jgi:hypothetical protein
MTLLPGVRYIACTALLCLASSPVLAQSRLSDISVGGSSLTEIRTGATFSATSTNNRGLGLTGEVTGSQFALWLLAGPRLSSGQTRGTVYAQILGGLVMAGGEPYFAVQPGAGVDFWMRRGLGARVGLDYQQWMTNGEAFQVFRVHAGVVVKMGRR